MTQFFFIKRD